MPIDALEVITAEEDLAPEVLILDPALQPEVAVNAAEFDFIELIFPGLQGEQGEAGAALVLSDAIPQALGAAAAGVSTEASRADHVHDVPTAAEVGADEAGTAASLIGQHVLNTDPHPEYLNAAEGQALITDHESSLDPHPQYLTFDEADANYAPLDAPGTTNLGYTASTRVLTSDTGSDVTLPLSTAYDAGLQSAEDKQYQDRDVKVFEPVRWFWVNRGVENFGRVGADGDYYFNNTTHRITATSNVALPAPEVYIATAADFRDPPVPFGRQFAVTAGYQVGDRLVWYDNWNWGEPGIYTIIDVGEDGVRPYILELIPEQHDRARRADPWKVYMETEVPRRGPLNAPLFELLYGYFYDVEPSVLGLWGAVVITTGQYSVALGPFSVSHGARSVAINSYDVGDLGVGIGEVTIAANNAVSVGPFARAAGKGSTAIGDSAQAYSFSSSAFGRGTIAPAYGLSVLDGERGAAVLAPHFTISSRSANWNDVGAVLRNVGSSNVTYTLPDTAQDTPGLQPVDLMIARPFPRGTSIQLVQQSTGTITAAAAVGVTLTGPILATKNPGDMLWLQYNGSVWTAFYISNSNFGGSYNELSGKPTLGNAAILDVGTTEDTVAAGDDPRIVNALPSNPVGIAGATRVVNLVEIPSTDYDTLVTKDPNTFYIVSR